MFQVFRLFSRERWNFVWNEKTMNFRKELDLLEEKQKKLIKELEKTNQKKIYLQIDEEIKKKTKDSECWMKALSDSKGDEKKATAKYIDLRYEILWEDTVEKIIEPFRKKVKEEYDARESYLVNRENK